MALFEKETRFTLLGIGIGATAVAAAPYVAAIAATVARPLTKALLTHGLEGFEKATETVARLSESLQDVVAEVQAERTQRQQAARGPDPVVVSSTVERPDPRAN